MQPGRRGAAVDVAGRYYSLLYYLLPTTYHLLLTAHFSLLAAYGVLLTTHHPPPTTHYGSASLEQRKKLLEELKVHPFNYAAMQAIQADFCKVRVVVSCQVTPCFSSLTPSVVNTC